MNMNEVTIPTDALYKRFCSTIRMRYERFDSQPASAQNKAIDATILRFYQDHGVLMSKGEIVKQLNLV